MLPSFLCPSQLQVIQDTCQEIDASSSSYYPTTSDFERNFEDYDTDSTLEKMQWQSWQDDVRIALLFAGLLSVLVTPFIIESNRKLRPNSEDVVINFLAHIATMASKGEIDTSPGAPSTIPVSSTPSTFTPNPAYIRANTLWLISLVLSLTTILIGSLISQWLRACRSYTLPTFTPSFSSSSGFFPSSSLFSASCGQTPLISPLFKDTFTFNFTEPSKSLPQHYNTITSNTLGKRHIRMVLSTLPLFLQLAVVLFLGGLMDYVQVFGDCGVWVSVGVVSVFVGFIFRTVVMH